jgi:hypothetical protein
MLLVHGGPDSLRVRLHSRESVAMTAADVFWFIVLVVFLLSGKKEDAK